MRVAAFRNGAIEVDLLSVALGFGHEVTDVTIDRPLVAEPEDSVQGPIGLHDDPVHRHDTDAVPRVLEQSAVALLGSGELAEHPGQRDGLTQLHGYRPSGASEGVPLDSSEIRAHRGEHEDADRL